MRGKTHNASMDDSTDDESRVQRKAVESKQLRASEQRVEREKFGAGIRGQTNRSK